MQRWLVFAVACVGCGGEPSSAEVASRGVHADTADDGRMPPPSESSEPWGSGAQPPTPAALPAELATRTYAAEVPSIELPQWKIAVVEAGEGPRVLAYRPAEVSRQARFVLGDDQATRMTMTIHWWSMANVGLDYGFAGLDCGIPLDPAFADSMAAAFEQVRVGCLKIRGQARRDGARLIQIAQTEGPPMTPATAELIELFAVPLPTEAIGIGGAWTATHASEGMTSSRHYRLLAVDGATLTIELTGEATMPDQSGEAAKGTLMVSLFDPLARSGTVEMTSRFPPGPGRPVTEMSLRIELNHP